MLHYEDHNSIVNALAFSPNGGLLASGTRDGAVSLRNLDGSVTPLLEPNPSNGAIYAMSFHPESSMLAVGGELGWSQYKQYDDGSWRTFGVSFNSPTNDLAYLDARTLTVGYGERLKPAPGAFELWDTITGRKIDPSKPDPHGIMSVAVAPRKKTVAWASCYRMVQVWDIQKQDPVKFPQLNAILALAISPDAKLLAVASDWVVRLYDLEKKSERAVLKVHKGRVPALAFSPDSRTLATGSWDQTVRLWDVESCRERECYQWPVGRVTRLTYAPDGMRLAAGGDTGAVVVWDME